MSRIRFSLGEAATLCIAISALMLGGCSPGWVVARASEPVLSGGVEAMNRETDLTLAESAIPANLKLLEGLINEAPNSLKFREFAAEGFYGYAFGFVEDQDPARASALYQRCLNHALQGLRIAGLGLDAAAVPLAELEQALQNLPAKAVPSLFWGASCWAKWIDMDRSDPARLADLGRAVSLMQSVLDRDDAYHFGGAHVFFGVYYASRPPALGGDYEKAQYHFERARAISAGRTLMPEVLYAQYYARQTLNKPLFHTTLASVIEQRLDTYPDTALENALAQRKARGLLLKEEEWF
jgi:hypothetical protein